MAGNLVPVGTMLVNPDLDAIFVYGDLIIYLYAAESMSMSSVESQLLQCACTDVKYSSVIQDFDDQQMKKISSFTVLACQQCVYCLAFDPTCHVVAR